MKKSVERWWCWKPNLTRRMPHGGNSCVDSVSIITHQTQKRDTSNSHFKFVKTWSYILAGTGIDSC